MKTLTNVVCKVENGKVTITADIADKTFGLPVNQTTVGYLNPKNIRYPRHCQISNEAYFVKAFGNGFAIMHDDLVRIAAIVEPKTTYPPLFTKQPDSENFVVEINSELNPDFQWQVSDEIKLGKENWTDIVGATDGVLDKSKVEKGKFVRCVAKSEAGTMYSNPVIVK